jgi:hypothetical protein
VLVACKYLCRCLIVWGKAESLFNQNHSTGITPTLLEKFRTDWKYFSASNALAYYTKAKIMTQKVFI